MDPTLVKGGCRMHINKIKKLHEKELDDLIYTQYKELNCTQLKNNNRLISKADFINRLPLLLCERKNIYKDDVDYTAMITRLTKDGYFLSMKKALLLLMIAANKDQALDYQLINQLHQLATENDKDYLSNDEYNHMSHFFATSAKNLSKNMRQEIQDNNYNICTKKHVVGSVWCCSPYMINFAYEDTYSSNSLDNNIGKFTNFTDKRIKEQYINELCTTYYQQLHKIESCLLLIEHSDNYSIDIFNNQLCYQYHDKLHEHQYKTKKQLVKFFEQEQLLLLAEFARDFNFTHYFTDGNGRVIYFLCLNYLLIKMGYSPFNMYSGQMYYSTYAEHVSYIQEGQKAFQEYFVKGKKISMEALTKLPRTLELTEIIELEQAISAHQSKYLNMIKKSNYPIKKILHEIDLKNVPNYVSVIYCYHVKTDLANIDFSQQHNLVILENYAKTICKYRVYNLLNHLIRLVLEHPANWLQQLEYQSAILHILFTIFQVNKRRELHQTLLQKLVKNIHEIPTNNSISCECIRYIYEAAKRTNKPKLVTQIIEYIIQQSNTFSLNYHGQAMLTNMVFSNIIQKQITDKTILKIIEDNIENISSYDEQSISLMYNYVVYHINSPTKILKVTKHLQHLKADFKEIPNLLTILMTVHNKDINTQAASYTIDNLEHLRKYAPNYKNLLLSVTNYYLNNKNIIQAKTIINFLVNNCNLSLIETRDLNTIAKYFSSDNDAYLNHTLLDYIEENFTEFDFNSEMFAHTIYNVLMFSSKSNTNNRIYKILNLLVAHGSYITKKSDLLLQLIHQALICSYDKKHYVAFEPICLIFIHNFLAEKKLNNKAKAIKHYISKINNTKKIVATNIMEMIQQ